MKQTQRDHHSTFDFEFDVMGSIKVAIANAVLVPLKEEGKQTPIRHHDKSICFLRNGTTGQSAHDWVQVSLDVFRFKLFVFRVVDDNFGV